MFKRILKAWKQVQVLVDISSGAAMGAWTVVVLILACTGKLTESVVEGYKAALYTFGAYTVARTAANHPKVTALLGKLWKK